MSFPSPFSPCGTASLQLAKEIDGPPHAAWQQERLELSLLSFVFLRTSSLVGTRWDSGEEAGQAIDGTFVTNPTPTLQF